MYPTGVINVGFRRGEKSHVQLGISARYCTKSDKLSYVPSCGVFPVCN